jgi:hypothetical protein
MTMDTGGNLTVHGAINATGPVTATGAVICAAGKFQIAPAYYLQRDSGGNWNIVENGMTTFSIGPSGGVTAQGNITAAGGEVSSVTYWASGKQVLGPQIAGWGASTGGARGPITATSTLAQVAAALAQLLTDLRTHGMIGG